MRLIKCGEMYSLDRRANPTTQLERAIGLFKLKHRCEPEGMQWNPGKLFKREGLDISVDTQLPPGHLWLDLPVKEDK